MLPDRRLHRDTAHLYLTEGVGEDFPPTTFDPTALDRWIRVSDGDAFRMARRITREEGILAGESSGTVTVAALTVARELSGARDGREAVIVVILPDGGRNYLSRLYNDGWMRKRGLLETTGGKILVGQLLRDRHGDRGLPELVVARTTDRVGAAIATLERYAISQMPVTEETETESTAAIVGAVTERGLLDRAYRDPSAVERTVSEVMEPPLPLIDVSASLDEAAGLLSNGARRLSRFATAGRRASWRSSTCSRVLQAAPGRDRRGVLISRIAACSRADAVPAGRQRVHYAPVVAHLQPVRPRSETRMQREEQWAGDREP